MALTQISSDGVKDGTVVNADIKSSAAIAFSKLQDVSATDRILGRDSSGAGDIEEITPANARTMLNVEDGADVTDSTNVNAAGAVMNSDLDVKGELLVGDGSGDPSALSVGTNDYVLTADSSEATGVKWAAAAGGGKLLKFQSANTSTQHAETSNSWSDTNLTIDFTPTAANSTLCIVVCQNVYVASGGQNGDARSYYQLLHDGTNLTTQWFETSSSNSNSETTSTLMMMSDVAASNTNSRTIKTQHQFVSSNGTSIAQHGSKKSYIWVLEIGA
jgi:hypothetical protein